METLPLTAASLDEAGLVRVLEEGAPGLHALARRMLGDDDEARDVVQEAWIRAWARRASLQDPAAAAGWVRVIVVRECLRALRWRAVRRWLPFGDVPEIAVFPRAEADLAAAEVAALARRAAERLPPRQRLCFGLRFDEGWTVAEIAAATGLSTETVKTHLGRALATVQEAVRGS